MFDSWDPAPAAITWWAVGSVIVVLAGIAVYTLVGAVILGLFLYYSTRPVYRWLVVHTELPRMAASVTLLLVGIPILAVLVYAGLVGVSELAQVLDRTGLTGLRDVLSPYVDVAELTDPAEIAPLLEERSSLLVAGVQGVLMWALRIFVAFTVGYYLLLYDNEIAAWADRSFPSKYGLVSFMEGVDDDLRTIYVGNLITIILTGAIAVAVYYAIDLVAPAATGINYPLLLGLLTAIATLIPAVGMKIVYLPVTGWLGFRAVTGEGPLWYPVLFLVVTFVVIDTVPDVFIRSYISKGDINMGFILLGYVLGAIAFGWYGVFLAPIILVLFLHFAHRVFPNLLDPTATRLVTDDWQN